MKINRLVLFVTALSITTINTTAIAQQEVQVPHLDLEMSSAEYAPYLAKAKKAGGEDEPSIAEALRLGLRLASWIAYENARRPSGSQIRLTSSGTRGGIPIDTPSQYSPAIVQTRLDGVMAEMPVEMRDILNTRLAYPEKLPVSDENFILLGRKLDRVYQTAARWKTLKPYMSYYIRYKAADVRGYYNLKKHGWTAERLYGYASLDADTKANLKTWLVLICLNANNSESSCGTAFETAARTNRLGNFYNSYYAAAEANWNNFFNIPASGARRDIVWNNSNPMLATMPFNRPSTTRIESYIRDNVEAEWSWKGWGLKLNFGNFPSGPRVEFQTGVVPHVNGIGGNQIVMDENQPVEEYESQWTIRHEFGHVLGFPDCYHEFYDQTVGAFINYQLDITDLMCSRAGDMNERLFNEMKRVYFKP